MLFLTCRSNFHVNIPTSVVCLTQRGLCAYVTLLWYVRETNGNSWRSNVTDCRFDATHCGSLQLWCFYIPWRNIPSGPRPSHYRGFVITLRHTTLGRTSLDDWSACHRDLYLYNTQHSQQTDIHAPGGIRTHNPSKLAATDSRLRTRGHWDRLLWCLQT